MPHTPPSATAFEHSFDDWHHAMSAACLPGLIRQVRTHRLRTWPGEVWIRREDEAAFAASGLKLRKYASLLQHLQAGGYAGAALFGGAHSNNLVALTQALREHGLEARLYIAKAHHPARTGNAFLLDLLADPAHVAWFPPGTTPQQAWQAAAPTLPPHLMPVPEGACCPQALPGAMTLARDLLATGPWQQVWMDSGTGLAAAALAHGMALAGSATRLHVVQVAGDFGAAWRVSRDWLVAWATQALGAEAGAQAGAATSAFWPQVAVHQPHTARSFGSSNATLWQHIRHMARAEGVLLDPAYTAKLSLTAFHALAGQGPGQRGPTLLVHSGGGTGLLGFGGR